MLINFYGKRKKKNDSNKQNLLSSALRFFTHFCQVALQIWFLPYTSLDKIFLLRFIWQIHTALISKILKYEYYVWIMHNRGKVCIWSGHLTPGSSFALAHSKRFLVHDISFKKKKMCTYYFFALFTRQYTSHRPQNFMVFYVGKSKNCRSFDEVTNVHPSVMRHSKGFLSQVRSIFPSIWSFFHIVSPVPTAPP